MNKNYYQIGVLIVIGNTVLICYTTLFPFNFLLPETASWNPLINVFDFHGKTTAMTKDLIQNVVLFIPYGMGLSAMQRAGQKEPIMLLLSVTLAGFALSLTVESLQLYLPSRVSAANDLLANTIGSSLGFYIFHVCGKPLFAKLLRIKTEIQSRLTTTTLAVSLLVYVVAIGISAIGLQKRINLANWDTNLILAVGNEPSTNRVWRGKMINLYFSDRSVTKQQASQLLSGASKDQALGDALVADYNPDPSGGLSDRLGNLPDLEWIQTLPITHGKHQQTPVVIQHWMRTLTPISLLTEKSRNTSQLTVGTTVEAESSNKGHSARIVAISANARHRNFILAQVGTSLAVGLRTPWSGDNARNPAFVVPNVFVDSQPHQVLVTFGGHDLRIYIDSTHREYRFSLTPSLTLYRYILPRRFWKLSANTVERYKILSWTLITVPILFMGFSLLKRRFALAGTR